MKSGFVTWVALPSSGFFGRNNTHSATNMP